MNTSIKSIHAREILDSRGTPTIQVDVTLESGVSGRAAVPSGASTGTHEALELRDKDEKRYHGLGVLHAVKNINDLINQELQGADVTDIKNIDKQMIDLDGTEDKSRLGANALVGVSLACAHAGANERNQPLHEHIRQLYGLQHLGNRAPRPLMNVLNGGKHADNGLSIQEFLISPKGESMSEMIRIGAEIFFELDKLLHAKGLDTSVGDEGGFAPRLKHDTEAFDYIVEAIQKAGYEPGEEVEVGIDAAASEWFVKETGKYKWEEENKELTPDELIAVYKEWTEKYPFVLIEDGLAEDDWNGWQRLTKAIGNNTRIIGDDLFVTNIERINRGVQENVANGLIIKPNQIGTLTESIDVIEFAQLNDYTVVVSHRSGSTNDTSIADIAIAVQSDFIKAGAPSRGERVAKYNRLIEIEEESNV